MEKAQAKFPLQDADWLTLAKLLVALTLLAYLPALCDGFVFDDGQLIIMNRLVRAHNGLYRFWFTTQASDYYPLTESLWWLQWRVFGYHPIGYHAVNIFLHVANAVLVWMILLRLKIPGAWLAAMIFAIHPANVATVAWISEQKNTLSMLFYAAAILLYLRFYEGGSWRWYGLSLTMFLLALLSKTAVVMLPIVLLGCLWWMHRRLRWKDVWYTIPFFMLSLVLGLVTVWFQHHRAMQGLQTSFAPSGSLLSRLAIAGGIPWFYLYKTLFPYNLMVVYPLWHLDASRWISYLPVTVLVTCFAVFWWKRKTWGRPWLFGLGYFVVGLLPVLGFIDQGFFYSTLVADHWLYHPVVGVIALVAAAAAKCCIRMGSSRYRYVGMLVVGVGLMLLGAATWRRSRVYATDETLWKDTVAKNPNAWTAYDNLGLALWQDGKHDDAIACFRRALSIKPDYAVTQNNLGFACLLQGNVGEAIEHYQQAVQLNPSLAETHHYLGQALARQGRKSEAIEQYQEALRLKPYLTATSNALTQLLQTAQ